jgi:hypothetical protein
VDVTGSAHGRAGSRCLAGRVNCGGGAEAKPQSRQPSLTHPAGQPMPVLQLRQLCP